jgi:hypothetical protein
MSGKKRTGTIGRGASGRIAAFAPTVEQRQLVRNMAGIGCTTDEILACIPWGRPDEKPISAATLRRYFRAELDRGFSVANMKVRKTLFEMATSGENTAATIFYAKCRLGMSSVDTVKVEATGKDGAPLPAGVAQTFVYLPQKDERPEPQQRPRKALSPAAAPLPLPEPSAGPLAPSWRALDADRPAAAAVGRVEPLNEHTDRAFRIDGGTNVR